jgi:hypothetical protein
MNIDFSRIATQARLLSEAAETKNVILMDTWFKALSRWTESVEKEFEKVVEEGVEFEASLDDEEARQAYAESLG